VEPISHFFYSDRLKLQFWDWGREGRPPLVLVHGGLDHARNWDAVARELRHDYHVYALDLRGHGNSAWAQGAMYTIAEHVLDLSALLDIIGGFPVDLVGHSLGGMIVTHYSGLYPERVRKLVNIEGIGFPAGHRVHDAAPDVLRRWIEDVRDLEVRGPHPYPNLDSAVRRMKEANPHLTDEVARHLTLHGTNWNSDGSMVWKFDNYARALPPYGHDIADVVQIFGRITCPVLLFWGEESFIPAPAGDPRVEAIRNCRRISVPNAGHWVHHDQLPVFLEESKRFLAGNGGD
jgi:pimeloyl-ACP methyl ester carboxylesterase